LSGKQINNQEFERLKMQLPSLNYTNEQNKTQLDSFETTFKGLFNNKLSVNGWGIAGEVGSNVNIDVIAPDGEEIIFSD